MRRGTNDHFLRYLKTIIILEISHYPEKCRTKKKRLCELNSYIPIRFLMKKFNT